MMCLKRVGLIFCALTVLFSTGCYVSQVDDNPGYSTGYLKEATYVTTKVLPALVYKDSVFGAIRSVALYRPDVEPNAVMSNSEVVEIAAGTKIRVTGILHENNIETGSHVYIEAEILSGPYSGVHVDLDHVSLHEKRSDLYLPQRDPDILQEARE